MPPGPHDEYGNVLSVVKDVLRRPTPIDDGAVFYRPSTAEKRYLEAVIDPDRLEEPVGPAEPSITVRRKRRPPHDQFRIDFDDPTVAFHRG